MKPVCLTFPCVTVRAAYPGMSETEMPALERAIEAVLSARSVAFDSISHFAFQEQALGLTVDIEGLRPLYGGSGLSEAFLNQDLLALLRQAGESVARAEAGD